MSRDPPRWPLQGQVRMPLQIGATSLVEAAVDSGGGMTIAVLTIVHVRDGTTLGLVVAGVGLLVLGAMLWLSRGVMTGSRACDVIMSSDGLRVEGGPRHGLALAWSEILPEQCRVENDRVPDANDKPVRGRQLRVGVRSGADVLLAEIWQTDDRDAFYVVLDEIRAVHGLPPLPPEQRTEPAQSEVATPTAASSASQLHCAACGAAAAPCDAASVVCRHCRATVEVPKSLRERLAGHAELATKRGHADALVLDILAQPGAHVANRWLALGIGLVFAAPIPCGLLYAALQADGASFGYALPLALASVALVGFAVTLTSWAFTRRVALRSCLLELGARRHEGDDRPACRGCGALLPEREGTVVVACSYCDCENLLGVDLRAWQHAEGTRQQTLAELLERRRGALRESKVNGALCFGVAAIALAWPVWRVIAG